MIYQCDRSLCEQCVVAMRKRRVNWGTFWGWQGRSCMSLTWYRFPINRLVSLWNYIRVGINWHLNLHLSPNSQLLKAKINIGYRKKYYLLLMVIVAMAAVFVICANFRQALGRKNNNKS